MKKSNFFYPAFNYMAEHDIEWGKLNIPSDDSGMPTETYKEYIVRLNFLIRVIALLSLSFQSSSCRLMLIAIFSSPTA